MTKSLRALLTEAIDYAGLFPPARLPLDDALRNFTHYAAGADLWLLSGFVCPASKLAELNACEAFTQAGPPWSFSVLGRSGKTVQEFETGLHADLRDIDTLRQTHGELVRVHVFETRVPEQALAASDDFWKNLRSALGAMRTFIEIPITDAWREHVAKTVHRLAQDKLAGFKLRCGGLEASAFPSVAQVAGAIALCRDAGVPMKFTAGLHHPLRCWDDPVRTFMHGFLNVFVAGVLAHARKLAEADLAPILEDVDPEHFLFDDEGLRWQMHRATTAEITAARRELVTSFGSCSFEEPCADLRGLGLLK